MFTTHIGLLGDKAGFSMCACYDKSSGSRAFLERKCMYDGKR